MPPELFRFRAYNLQESALTVNSDITVLINRNGDIRPGFYPGQPISFTWRFWDLWGDKDIINLTGAKIIARVLLHNRIDVLYMSKKLTYVKGGTTETVLNIQVPQGWFHRLENNRELIVQVSVDKN